MAISVDEKVSAPDDFAARNLDLTKFTRPSCKPNAVMFEKQSRTLNYDLATSLSMQQS